MSSIASRSSLIAAARLPTPTGPPSNFSMIVRSSRRSISSKPCSSTSSSGSAASRHVGRDVARRRAPARSRAPAAAAGSRRAACRASAARSRARHRASIGTPRIRAERRTISSMSSSLVEIEPVDDAEARAQRRGQQPRARRRADEREALDRHLDRPRARALPDHDVELVVLHRRIEDLLDRRAHAVDFVDEQHLALLEVASASPRDRPASRSPGRRSARIGTPSSLRDHVGERGLAESRRAVEQHVIERLAALPGRRDRHVQVLADALLADVLVERARPEPRLVLGVLVVRSRRSTGDRQACSLGSTSSLSIEAPRQRHS